MAKKTVLTAEQYALIDSKITLAGEETYSVVRHKHRGQHKWSIHVFTRTANEHELQAYESKATSVEFRGRNAKVRGSQVMAARTLYDQIINRVYDIPVGSRVLGDPVPLTTEEAIKRVDVMTKRAAIVDLVGQVWAGSAGDDDDDDEPGESAASE